MRFWDASAVIPLLIGEAGTSEVRRLTAEDAGIAVWWGTVVECVAAAARRLRATSLSPQEFDVFARELRRVAGAWYTVEPSEGLRNEALRFARVHALPVGDALQLAAAVAWADGAPHARQFVSFDQRLSDAGRLEGFDVVSVEV